MKKINLIIALSTLTMGAIIPTIILTCLSQNKIKNEDDMLNNDCEFVNDKYDDSIDEVINANSATCFAEDSGENANSWMGITGAEFVKFTITKDYVSNSDVGTLMVSGISSANIVSTKLEIPSYIINDGKRYDVTSIGFEAFVSCANLSGDLILKSGLLTIGNSAFALCDKITSITLSNTLTSIGDNAFVNCVGLTDTLIISDSIIEMGKFAFAKCSNIKQLVLGKGLTKLDEKTFIECKNLSGVLNIPDNIKTIEAGCFTACEKISQIKFGSGLEKIGSQSFGGCIGLTGNLNISNTVSTIESAAFSKCANIDSLTIGENVSLIGASAFNECTKLSGNLIFSKKMANIENNAFLGCNLNSAEFLNITPPSLGTNIFSKSKAVLNADITILIPHNSKPAYDLLVSNLGLANDLQLVEKLPTAPTITLDILDEYEQDIDVKAVSFKTIFTAKATINDSIDQDVSWSIPLTTGVQINSTTGEVQADITKVNTYTFIITATMKNDPTVTASKTVTIKIIDPNIPTNDFPWWAYLIIIGTTTVLVSVFTITIVTSRIKK